MAKLQIGSILLIVCFFIMAISCFTSEDLNTDLRFIRTCNRTSPIHMSTMNEFLIHKKLVASESSAFKCFLHCLFTKYSWMDDEGGFLLHNIKGSLEEANVEIDRLEFILYRCTAIESVDKCERTYLFTRCFWGKIAEQQPSKDQLFYSIDDDTYKE